MPCRLHHSCGKMWWISTFSPKKTVWSNCCPERKNGPPASAARFWNRPAAAMRNCCAKYKACWMRAMRPAVSWRSAPDILWEARAAAMVGTAVGHYRLENLLGRGGMGLVYRATDLCLARTVAVKLLRPEKASTPEARRRFLRE